MLHESLAEFDHVFAALTADASVSRSDAALPVECPDWNAALALLAQGRFAEGQARAARALSSRLRSAEWRDDDPHGEDDRIVQKEQRHMLAGSADDSSFQIDLAFRLATTTAKCLAITTCCGDSSQREGVDSDCLDVMERSVSLGLLTEAHFDQLTDKIARGTLTEATAAMSWELANDTAQASEAARAACRSELASIVVAHALEVQERSASEPILPRVLSTALNEARLWDPAVEIPQVLAPVDRFALKRCDACGICADRLWECNRCRAAHYCGVACQRQAWKAGHKLVCQPRCQRPAV